MPLNISINEKFRNAFEQKCFQLIVEAYITALTEKVVQLDWNENDISQELNEKIDENSKRIKWNILVNREHYLPKNTNKTKGFADKLPRIDLRMTNIYKLFEYKYFCEAKRLKENDSQLKRAYINEGMDRYISKKYPLGCMLGYLLEGKTNKTVAGINNLLKKDKRGEETLKLKSNKLLKSTYESNHAGINVLKHYIFDFAIVSN